MNFADKAVAAEGDAVVGAVRAEAEATGAPMAVIQWSGLPRIQTTLPTKRYATYGC